MNHVDMCQKLHNNRELLGRNTSLGLKLPLIRFEEVVRYLPHHSTTSEQAEHLILPTYFQLLQSLLQSHCPAATVTSSNCLQTDNSN